MNVNVEALEDVIASVEKRPEERFNMARWRDGTICCAWGSFVEEYGEKYGVAFTDGMNTGPFKYGGIGRCGGFGAAGEILGIPYEDARFLFAPRSYDNPSKPAVLARLRKYLTEHSAAVGN